MKIIKTSEALPKSGRYVLAWLEGAKIPMRAMWAAQHTLPLGDDADPEWGEYSEEKDEYFCPAGWYEMNQFEEQHWGVSGNVVAWCELPRLDHQCLAQIEEPAQPVLYVSPGQLANHSNPEGPESEKAGRYLPARKTPAGKFIQPLYAGAAPAAVAGSSDERAAVLDAARDLIELRDEYAQKTQNAMPGNEYWSERFDAKYQALAAALAAASALEAPAAGAPQGEYPHEQMDAMALDRYKVVPSNASMLWSHAVVAGDGTQQLYVGREVECQNMARKFAGAFLDGAFAFHSTAAAPTAQAAPALEAPAAPPVPVDEFRGDTPSLVRNIVALLELDADGALVPHGVGGHARGLLSAAAARLAAAPQAPAALDELRQIADIAACWGCDHPDAPGDTELLRRIKWAARQLRAVSQAPVAPVAPAEPAGKAHDWRENASYGGEICAECGATKGSRRGNAPCTWPPAKTAKRWPFLESPGEFTARLEAAIRSFGGLLPAVRNVLIEHPPTLVAAPAAPAVDASDDKALLDFLQQTATAVEVLAQDEGEPPRFLVNRAISKDVRSAIRLARGKAIAAQAKEGGGQ